MKNYGLATLTLVVGLALGVAIGLLIDSDSGGRAELLATQNQLAQTQQQLETAQTRLEASEEARRAAESEFETLQGSVEEQQRELLEQIDAVQRENQILMERSIAVGSLQATASAAVTSHLFILEQLFAFAQSGFVTTPDTVDPATEDGLAELPVEVAAEVRAVLTDPDPAAAEARYWQALQPVLNSLQAESAG